MSKHSLKTAFQTLAEDALRLEINTIVKPEMTGCKMPASRREALWSLATKYHVKLEELGYRGEPRWQSAGLMSFLEFFDCAKAGIAATNELLVHALPEHQAELKHRLLILYRIQRQSEQIVSMFKALAEQENLKLNVKDLSQRLEAHHTDAVPPIYDEASKVWNNDIPRVEMTNIPDLKLDVAQLSLVRKAWEIGTEEILLQSIIQIEGDITTRLSEQFAANQNAFIANAHNHAIETSVRFWTYIVQTIGAMATSLTRGGKDLLR